jgi:chromosome segregation ATPase
MKFYFKYKVCYLIVLLFYNNLILAEMTNSLTDMEFENDLIKLLTKLHEKRRSSNENDNAFINVRINNTYDLRDFLDNIDGIKMEILKQKENYKDLIFEEAKKLSERIEKNKENFNKIKQRLDFVIEKTNFIQGEINIQKSEEMNIKSSLDVIKPEYENINEKFFNNAMKKGKVFNTVVSDFNNFNNKLSNLTSDLEKRDSLKESLENLKRESNKTEIELNINKKLAEETHGEAKFLNTIDEVIKSNFEEIKLENNKIDANLKTLKDRLKNNERSKSLDSHKNEIIDYYKTNSKEVKKLIAEQEELDIEIKEIMKKKNKIKTEINTNDIEHSLKLSNLKSDINKTEQQIKEFKKLLVQNILNSKKNTLESEAKIKNLILILNKLLLIHKPKDNTLLNNLIFGNGKKFNLNDINHNLIEQITKNILKD